MNTNARLSTGIAGLDAHLGGGLIPGTMAVVVGATGIGKTQLGLQFLEAGRRQEGRGGIILDLSARIDSQSHADYAGRMFNWPLRAHQRENFARDHYYEGPLPGDLLHVFSRQGRRVTQRDMDFDAWHDWQTELASELTTAIDFFYANFVRGARRVIIDGIEPVERPSESIQFELLEYVYHQILRKEHDWVARDLFREAYRAHADAVALHAYDNCQIGTMLLATSHESMLEALIERPLVDGDVLATANTLIYMGKLREADGRMGRGLYIAKHRGSACSEDILRFAIDDRGIRIVA